MKFRKGDRVSFVLNDGKLYTTTVTDVVERQDGSLHLKTQQYPDISLAVDKLGRYWSEISELTQ